MVIDAPEGRQFQGETHQGIGDFLHDPVIKMPCFQWQIGGADSIPGWGTKIPHAVWLKKGKRKNWLSLFMDSPDAVTTFQPQNYFKESTAGLMAIVMVLGRVERTHKASDDEGTTNICFLATILVLSTFIVTKHLE